LLSEHCTILEHLDRLCGLPYGGATCSKALPNSIPKLHNNLGMVAAVHDFPNDTSSPSFEMHLEPWIGAILE
jgi:hypothetical protein